MKAVLVIAPKNFRDEELFDTKAELDRAGIETKIAGKTKEEATGMLGGKATPELTLEEINAEAFDAIVFVGGSGASIYFDDANALNLAKAFAEKGKVVAAICIAPSTLANAGLLEGKNATSFSSERSNLENKGAKFSDKKVVVDGKIITARGPEAAKEFGQAIAKALK